MVLIGCGALVRDQQGNILLIRRDDTRTWAPPGGSMERHESPHDVIIREIFEETGIEAVPERLIGLYHLPFKPYNIVQLFFACRATGGTLTPSAESPQLNFFPPHKLPSPILQLHQSRLQHALHPTTQLHFDAIHMTPTMHLGHFLLTRIIYPAKDSLRRWRRQPAYTP
ncbi:MAG TPA: NUDIX domain-containing protein, partial [Anaerolineae bacterium]|nr:NUDIX domain-containing protein [Anaerolineae bacterium]